MAVKEYLEKTRKYLGETAARLKSQEPENELQRLSRQELMEIIYQLKKNEQELQTRLAEAEKKLQEREINISKAGSIADASLKLNEIFETAQKAADDYLRTIKANYAYVDAWLKKFRELYPNYPVKKHKLK